jgi:hypothetical protein
MAFRTAAQLVILASEKLPTDQNATQSEKRLMNVGSSFAADAQFGGCWKEKGGEIHRNEPSVKARQNIECGLEEPARLKPPSGKYLSEPCRTCRVLVSARTQSSFFSINFAGFQEAKIVR